MQKVIDSRDLEHKGNMVDVIMEGINDPENKYPSVKALMDYVSQSLNGLNPEMIEAEDINSVIDALANVTVAADDSTDRWTCEKCGKTNLTSNFCPDCGNPKPDEVLIYTGDFTRDEGDSSSQYIYTL